MIKAGDLVELQNKVIYTDHCESKFTIEPNSKCVVLSVHDAITLLCICGDMYQFALPNTPAFIEILKPVKGDCFTPFISDWNVMDFNYDKFEIGDESIIVTSIHDPDEVILNISVPKRDPELLYFKFTKPEYEIAYAKFLETVRDFFLSSKLPNNKTFILDEVAQNLIRSLVFQYTNHFLNRGAITFEQYLSNLDEALYGSSTIIIQPENTLAC